MFVALALNVMLTALDLDATQLSIKAEAIDAVADGPVIIKVNLSYKGKKPLTVLDWTPFPNKYIHVHAPEHWTRRDAWGRDIKALVLPRTLKPGEQYSEFVFLHHRFAKILPGKASLKVHWLFADRAAPDRILAAPGTTVAVDVARDSMRNLARIRERIEQQVEFGDPRKIDAGYLASELEYTKHLELYPAALRLLQLDRDCPDSLRRHVFQWSRTSRETHERLIQHLARCGVRSDLVFFELWRSNKVRLSDSDADALLGGHNPWIRLYALKHYPERCDAGIRDWIKRDVEDLQKLLEKDKD